MDSEALSVVKLQAASKSRIKLHVNNFPNLVIKSFQYINSIIIIENCVNKHSVIEKAFYNVDMKQNWLSLLVLIAVIAAAYFIVQSVRESAQTAANAASAPFDQVRQANEGLQTQVAGLLNPTPTIIPDPVTYINEVRALARLETIQYSIEKVITAEIGQGTFDFLFGDRLLFVAHGVVIAGIDMEKIGPEHLRLENGVLYVTLPPAEIFIATLDNQKSYVYDRDTGFLNQGVQDLETLARQTAEDEIRRAALEDGILQQAQTNAENYLFRFFQALGYENVIFTD